MLILQFLVFGYSFLWVGDVRLISLLLRRSTGDIPYPAGFSRPNDTEDEFDQLVGAHESEHPTGMQMQDAARQQFKRDGKTKPADDFDGKRPLEVAPRLQDAQPSRCKRLEKDNEAEHEHHLFRKLLSLGGKFVKMPDVGTGGQHDDSGDQAVAKGQVFDCPRADRKSTRLNSSH